MVQNKKILPILVILIAMGFHCVDIFTSYTIENAQLLAIDVFLAPFGLGGLLRAGHKSYLATKKIASTDISEADVKKLKDILAKIP